MKPSRRRKDWAQSVGCQPYNRSLGERTGLFLVFRNRQGISLTVAGEQAVSYARIILEQTAALKRLSDNPGEQLTGTIRIGAFPSARAALLEALQKRHPLIQTRTFEGSYQEIREWIRSGVVDVGYVIWPPEEFEGVFLMDDPLKAVLPIEHPLASESVISFERVAREPFIMPMAGCEALVEAEIRKRRLSFNIRQKVADNATILKMVEAALGITVVPALTLPTPLPAVTVRDVTPALQRQIGLAVLSLGDASEAVHALVKEAQLLYNS